jgi:hypothetical protein
VSPFQRAILMKPQAPTGLKSAPRYPTVDDGRRYLHWDAVRPGSRGVESPLKRIVVCAYRSGVEGARVVRLKPVEAVHELAALCFNYHQLGAARAWKALMDVAARTPVDVLEFGGAAAGADACT